MRDVEISPLVFTSAGRQHLGVEVEEFLHLPLARVVALQAPDLSAAPIGHKIDAVQRGELLAAINADPNHTGTLIHMIVFRHRQDAEARCSLFQLDRKRMTAVQQLPAVILPALAIGGLKVHLLPKILPDVCDE